MIFLDANVFLRVLTSSDDPRVQQSSVRAQGLLLRVERDEVAATTSDAVLAEVAFILTSPRHYRLSVADAAAMLATIVSLRGFKMRQKLTVFRGLDMWAANPRIGFVDTLTAAYAQNPDMSLATFDADFDRFPGIIPWAFDESV